jgi:hypothetical protein
MQTSELSKHEPSSFELEIDIPIPGELIQAGGNILLSEVHIISNCIWNKEELPQ